MKISAIFVNTMFFTIFVTKNKKDVCVMRKILLLLLASISLATSAQVMITDKGYFFSPDGFKCKYGHIYTKDLKTMVKAGWYGRDDWDQHYLVEKLIEIPSGAQVIPSHLLYGPAGEAATGYNWLYAVVIRRRWEQHHSSTPTPMPPNWHASTSKASASTRHNPV